MSIFKKFVFIIMAGICAIPVVAMEQRTGNVTASRKRTRTYAEPEDASDVDEVAERFDAMKVDVDIEDLEDSLASAPKKIHNIINKLLNPHTNKEFYRYIMLSGPSQSGKSTLAKAIAYCGLKRPYLFVTPEELLNDHRSGTLKNIKKLFIDLSSCEKGKKPVLILDEFNVYTDNYGSEHKDTDETSKGIWTLLDKQQKNDGFFMIATSNETKKMPPQMQKRFFNKIITIGLLDVDGCKRMLARYLEKHKNIVVAQDCDDAYLTQLAQRLENARLTDESKVAVDMTLVNALVNEAVLLAENENDGQMLSKVHLDYAYTSTLDHIKDYCDFKVQTTDEERRHKESMDLQRELHNDSKKTQWELSAQQQEYALANIDRNERFALSQATVQNIASIPTEATQSIPWIGGLLGVLGKTVLNPNLLYQGLLDERVRMQMMYPPARQPMQQDPANQPAQELPDLLQGEQPGTDQLIIRPQGQDNQSSVNQGQPGVALGLLQLFAGSGQRRQSTGQNQ